MVELLQFDVYIFNFLNQHLVNGFFDAFFPVITNVHNWYIVYAIGFFFLVWKGGTNGRLCTAAALLTISLTDPLNSRVIKELVGRDRPFVTNSSARVIVAKPGGKSFPSSHAVNNAAQAVIFSIFFFRYRWFWWSIAILIGFSRIYVGVHYPLDILGGFVEGGILGYVVSMLVLHVYKRFKNRKTAEL